MEHTRELLLAVVVGAIAVTGGIVATGIGGGPPGPDETAGPTDTNRIGISAGGEAEAEPDQAEVRIEARARAGDPATARDRVARNVSRMRTALSEAGVPDDAVTTLSFDVYETREHRRDDEGETVYRARHEFRIETGVDRAGRIIDVALNNGATSIDGVRFTLTEATRDQVREEALTDAMTAARTQAETLAAEGDLRITGVRTISTGGAEVQEARVERFQATPTAVGDAGTELESGPVTVRVHVDVTYAAE